MSIERFVFTISRPCGHTVGLFYLYLLYIYYLGKIEILVVDGKTKDEGQERKVVMMCVP